MRLPLAAPCALVVLSLSIAACNKPSDDVNPESSGTGFVANAIPVPRNMAPPRDKFFHGS